MQIPRSVLASAVVLVLWACNSGSDTVATTPVSTTVTFKATLNGANERPNPTTSTGTGTFTGTFDPATNLLTYSVTFTGLTTNSTLAHIHGPGTTSDAVGIIVNFASGATPFVPGSTSGSFAGTVLLTAANQITTTINGDSLKKLLDAGLTYANIHSTTNGGGEIRGQIVKQ